MNLFLRIRSSVYTFYLRCKGYQIGKGVVIGFGSYIQGRNVQIGANSHFGNYVRMIAKTIKIGENSLIYDRNFIMVGNTFELGQRCKISHDATIHAHNVYIGNELWCNPYLEVGGGGCNKESANLYIGSYVHIGKKVSLNVCAEIHIGNQTGIGIETSIFTHSSGNGQSVIEGYGSVEAGVDIGSNVSIFTRVIIAPGVSICDGTTIGAQAYVSKSITECGLYVGIPSRKVKDIIPVPKDKWIDVMKEHMLDEINPEVFVSDNLQEEILENKKQIVVFIDNNLFFNRCEMICEDQEIVYINTLNKRLQITHGTEFHIPTMTLTGETTKLSEQVRDIFRRKGMIFDWNGYRPYMLSYEGFIKIGVEQ